MHGSAAGVGGELAKQGILGSTANDMDRLGRFAQDGFEPSCDDDVSIEAWLDATKPSQPVDNGADPLARGKG
jgi:hypothetical protein